MCALVSSYESYAEATAAFGENQSEWPGVVIIILTEIPKTRVQS